MRSRRSSGVACADTVKSTTYKLLKKSLDLDTELGELLQHPRV